MAPSERGLIVHSKGLELLALCRKAVNICRGVDGWLQENMPNGSIVELNFRNLRIPIFVQDRANVKHRQYASDDEVHFPES